MGLPIIYRPLSILRETSDDKGKTSTGTGGINTKVSIALDFYQRKLDKVAISQSHLDSSLARIQL